MKKNFAQLLQGHVATSGIRHVHLASVAGISSNYLARLLAGTRHPSDQVIGGLAEALHLSREQKAELFSSAGFVPPINLITESGQEQKTETALVSASLDSASTNNPIHQLTQQFYQLAQEVPERLQAPFFEEMRCLLGYARYKYLLNSGLSTLDLDFIRSTAARSESTRSDEQAHFDVIAQMVGELRTEPDQALQGDRFTEGTLSTLDQLIGDLLAGTISEENYHSHLVTQTLDILNQGAPWEIRRRMAKALPALCRLDPLGAIRLMEVLRLDLDEARGPDIRRRVVEALPALFDTSPQSLPVLTRLLQPRQDDDVYTALATVEACGDLQMRSRALLEKNEGALIADQLSRFLSEIASLQRNLPLNWDMGERESLQFSMALHNLLLAPDTLLLSLEEGLRSQEMLIQLVTVRYLERILPARPAETLKLYLLLPRISLHKNVRRAIAKALPTLLQSLRDTPLSIRALTRSVILTLAKDSDVLIRRAVADHAMQIFSIDREFLQVLLRQMYKDSDQAIRHRLRPVALCLAETWLVWYAETAGLVNAARPGHAQSLKQPFGE